MTDDNHRIMRTGLVIKARGTGTIVNRANPDNLMVILVQRVEDQDYTLFEGDVDELAELVELGLKTRSDNV